MFWNCFKLCPLKLSEFFSVTTLRPGRKSSVVSHFSRSVPWFFSSFSFFFLSFSFVVKSPLFYRLRFSHSAKCWKLDGPGGAAALFDNYFFSEKKSIQPIFEVDLLFEWGAILKLATLFSDFAGQSSWLNLTFYSLVDTGPWRPIGLILNLIEVEQNSE